MDLINALMNEKGAVADRNSAISFSDFHAAVQKMVEAEIEKHSADGIGRVDYAVASGGGKLLYHSEGYYAGNKLSLSWREIFRRIFSLNNLHPLANEILTPKFGEPGRCLPLKDSEVLVFIKLRIPIFPRAVTLEHVSKMITEAITSLKKRTRSSHYAITAYMGNKYRSKFPVNFKKLLTIQLRNLARSGKLTKVKNSFKLSDELKKSVKPKAAKHLKPKAVVSKPAAKPKVASRSKKVPKPAKIPAKVTEVLKVYKPKLAASTEKVKKATTPVKKDATVKKETPTGKLVVAKKLAKALKRADPLKPKKVVPAGKKAQK